MLVAEPGSPALCCAMCSKRLDGVDLSLGMLEKAKEKNVYDRIHLGEMLSYMLDKSNSYDVILSAATLIHFGDLLPVFRAAASSLKDGGLFIFTVFRNESGGDEDFVVFRIGFLPEVAATLIVPTIFAG